MGVQLVVAALAVEPDKLNDRARLVLLSMAANSYDHPRGGVPAGTYYGGRIRLAASLGRYPTDSVLREIRRDIATLIALGLIERLERGHNGRSSVYRLHIRAVRKSRESVDNPP